MNYLFCEEEIFYPIFSFYFNDERTKGPKNKLKGRMRSAGLTLAVSAIYNTILDPISASFLILMDFDCEMVQDIFKFAKIFKP